MTKYEIPKHEGVGMKQFFVVSFMKQSTAQGHRPCFTVAWGNTPGIWLIKDEVGRRPYSPASWGSVVSSCSPQRTRRAQRKGMTKDEGLNGEGGLTTESTEGK